MKIQAWMRAGATALRYVVGLAFATGCLGGEAQGGLTRYASRAEWQAAVGTHQTEDFESLEDLSTISMLGGVFSTDHFDIVIDANHGRIGPASGRVPEFPTPSPGLVGTFFVGDVHSPGDIAPLF
jgi:hypothetical protein